MNNYFEVVKTYNERKSWESPMRDVQVSEFNTNHSEDECQNLNAEYIRECQRAEKKYF